MPHLTWLIDETRRQGNGRLNGHQWGGEKFIPAGARPPLVDGRVDYTLIWRVGGWVGVGPSCFFQQTGHAWPIGHMGWDAGCSLSPFIRLTLDTRGGKGRYGIRQNAITCSGMGCLRYMGSMGANSVSYSGTG